MLGVLCPDHDLQHIDPLAQIQADRRRLPRVHSVRQELASRITWIQVESNIYPVDRLRGRAVLFVVATLTEAAVQEALVYRLRRHHPLNPDRDLLAFRDLHAEPHDRDDVSLHLFSHRWNPVRGYEWRSQAAYLAATPQHDRRRIGALGRGHVYRFPLGDSGPTLIMLLGKKIVAVGPILIFLGFLFSNPDWSCKPLINLGKISYGLYVFHVMAIQFCNYLLLTLGFYETGTGSLLKLERSLVQLLLAFVLTLLLAYTSYELFEKHFMVLKDRFAIIHSRSA